MASVVQTIPAASPLLTNVDKVVQSVTNATKRLSQISTNTTGSSKRRKAQNKIGPWKLGRTLGRGSTGRVRLAKNVNTGKLAAVKIVPKLNFKKLENPKYKTNDASKLPYGIEREIIIMKLISHPNIMGLYDVWENKNDLYLILEYIEGGELFDYLIKRGKLQEFEAINYFKQIIQGIGYLHQFNICHRDLKPENLLLDFNKNIKIADFGMAALEVDRRLLETSCGSPHYASPEIVAGRNYHGAPSDIWSCGIILFALLTGHLPFDDENIRRLLLKVQKGKFIMPSDLSWEAKDLISRMLQVSPNDRIPIEEILRHPLLTKYPDPANQSPSTQGNLIWHSNIKPIQSIDRLDPEIIRNLCILFHNCPKELVIKCLLSPKRSPEKMFYYLLMKYRNEHSTSTGASNYIDDDTDLTASESKQTLPRSTSIVKTTLTSPTGEQFTTVKKVSRSPSVASSSSSNKKALANITNTSFTASNAHKKKTLMSNTVISRTTSTMSLKSKQRPTLASSTKMKSESIPILRKLTPANVFSELAASDDKENMDSNENNERSKVNPTKEQTIANFEKVCQEVFGFDADTQSIFNMTVSSNQKSLSHETLNKLNILNNRLSRASLRMPTVQDFSSVKTRKLSSAERTEKKLAAEVQRKNDARERQIKVKDALTAEKRAEQRRQSRILQEKLREALLIILNNQNRNSSLPSSKVSSLDPRFGTNPLLRAKTLSARSPPSSAWNDKNSKVLQKLGIDIKNSPLQLSMLSRSSSVVKASTSKNLAGILNGDEEAQDKDNISLSKFDDAKSLASFNDRDSMHFNTYPLKKENTNMSVGYRSMLNVIDEDNANVSKDFATINEDSSHEDEENGGDYTRMSIQTKPGLIPNPRFSRISFNGLLNSKYDSANFTINLNTLSSGTVIKKSTRKLLATIPGNGVIKKSATREFPGLGISVHKNDSKVDTNGEGKARAASSASMERAPSRRSSTRTDLQRMSTTRREPESISETLTSSSTMADEYDLSDDLINMTQDFNEQDQSASRSFDAGGSFIQTEAVAVPELRKASSRLSDESKETLVAPTAESIKSMYKSYETLYNDKKKEPESRTSRDSKRVLEDNSFNAEASNVHVLDTSSLFDDSHFSNAKSFKYQDKLSSSEDEIDMDTSMEVTKSELLIPHRHGTIKNSLRRSHASTQIFSSANLAEKQNLEPDSPEASKKEAPVLIYTGLPDNTIVEHRMEDEKPGLFRKISLNPKREAPKAPEKSKWGDEEKSHNRFSAFYPGYRKTKDQENKPQVGNWFKRLFSSFTKSSKNGDKSPMDLKTHGRDIQIIDTNLRCTDIMRVIKNQLKLKEIEGSVTNVDIDEEFALISGVVPSRFARGRKLHFKIEIIDLVTTSTLHVIKIKGSRTGFRNLVQVVKHVVKQEEEASNVRNSTIYNFNGRKSS